MYSSQEYQLKKDLSSEAHRIFSDSSLRREYMRKTRPCYDTYTYHRLCNIKKCDGVHFLEEYRVVPCILQNFCKRKERGDCGFFHPERESEQEYISRGIALTVLPRKEWEDLVQVIKDAKRIMKDKSTLRKHYSFTRKCIYEENCFDLDCSNAHFSDEYKIPICLFKKYCNDKGCRDFHPERDILEEYKKPYFKYSSKKILHLHILHMIILLREKSKDFVIEFHIIENARKRDVSLLIHLKN